MSKNLDITAYDFENICRTCLSREDLKPLYESMLLPDMLMSFTFATFTKEDGLPVNICVSCICEIKQAFSVAKRCEATDGFLRECVKKTQTEFANNLSQAQTVVPINEVKKEIEMPQNVSPDNSRFVEDVLEDFQYEEEDMRIENVCDETYKDSGDQSYQDTMCSETFDNPEPRCEPYPGGIYNEVFTSLNHSQRIHTEENLSAQRKLAIRNTSNTGEKQYVCSFCSKTFCRLGWFNEHMKTHSGGEKPHSCVFCDKSFARESVLKRHKRSHMGVRPYTCSVCSKTFILPHNLKIHMRIHRGEKPYTCTVCNKSFTQSNTLKRHENTHLTKSIWFLKPNI